jgi:hypothetical protein
VLGCAGHLQREVDGKDAAIRRAGGRRLHRVVHPAEHAGGGTLNVGKDVLDVLRLWATACDDVVEAGLNGHVRAVGNEC